MNLVVFAKECKIRDSRLRARLIPDAADLNLVPSNAVSAKREK